MKKISIIVAVDENWLIGKQDSLPWHLPADLRHFKEITTGHTVIMGRKTHDSIGKPLPNRINVIITRGDQVIPGCITVNSPEKALEASPEENDIFIIGGAQIFAQFMPLAQKMYLTQIHHKFNGDILFPKINLSEWREVERRDFDADDKNPYSYSFSIFERIN